jgi:hypothetical protein
MSIRLYAIEDYLLYPGHLQHQMDHAFLDVVAPNPARDSSSRCEYVLSRQPESVPRATRTAAW